MTTLISDRGKGTFSGAVLLLAVVMMSLMLLLMFACPQVRAEDSPDMMIFEEDIGFSRLDATKGEKFVVYAYVRNVGNTAGNATVRFYFEGSGYPLGTFLGESNITVHPGGSTVPSVNVTLSEGVYRFTVSIDNVTPEDPDFGNNVASNTVEVFSSGSAVQFSTPTLLMQDAQVTIQGGSERIVPLNVTDQGGRATDVSLRILESSGVFAESVGPLIDIDSGQTLLVHLRISVPAMSHDSAPVERRLLVQANGSNARGNVVVVTLVIHPSVEQVSWWNTATAAVAAASALSIFFGSIHAFEPSRYKLLGLLFPLYTKLKKEDVLEQYTRGEIHGYIKANPGDYFTSIGKALGITGGNLAYHLRVLEREGQIISTRDGARKRFYPRGAKVDILNGDELSAVQKSIYKIIRETPGIRQKEIASLMGVTSSTVSYHLQKLVAKGTLRSQRKGMSVCYFLAEKRRVVSSGGKAATPSQSRSCESGK